MAITDETPQVSKGFKEWQRQIFRVAPQRLNEMTKSAARIRAITSTGKHKR